LLLLTLLAFWRSVVATAPLLGVDTAAGLAPVLPLLGVWLAIGTSRARARAGKPLTGAREGALDVPAAALLLAASGWLIWFAPAQDGWYFWSRRLDLLAAGLFALGVAVLVWGVQTVWWHRLAAAYAVLVWPDPLARLQDLIATPLALATAVLARPLATLAGANLAPVPDGGNLAVFSGADPQSWTILVGDVCSGLNAGLAVAMVCVPAAVWLGLSWRRALPWAAGGVLLALLSNVVRVTSLFVVADRAGPEFALGSVHPVLGAILLAVVFAVLWLLAPAKRVAVPSANRAAAADRTLAAERSVSAQRSLPAQRDPATPKGESAFPKLTRPPFGKGSALRLTALAALVAVFAVASMRIGAFATLPPIGPPGGSVSEPIDYLRVPDGWTVVGQDALGWQNLFGPESHSYALTLQSPEGALVKAQVVTTPDQGRLDTYGLEACRVYHGEDVVGRRSLDLGAGGVAYLIDTRDSSPINPAGQISVVYWEAPFLLDGRLEHARVALFVVEADAGILPETAAQPGFAPGGSSFDIADGVLVSFAADSTRAILASQERDR
jgi:exosortase/archaeosortase family protein